MGSCWMTVGTVGVNVRAQWFEKRDFSKCDCPRPQVRLVANEEASKALSCLVKYATSGDEDLEEAPILTA